jgi:hypothetical protein
MLTTPLFRASLSLLTLCAVSACQYAPQWSQNRGANTPISLPAFQSQTNTSEFADDQGDSLTQDLFRDFDQGVIKENLNIHSQGYLSLNPNAQQGLFVSRPLQAPFAFDAFLSGWNSTQPVKVEYRTGNDPNTLGQWQTLGFEKDAKLPQKQRFLQYKVTLERPENGSADVRFEGIHFLFGIQRPQKTQAPQRRPHNVQKPAVVSREAWRARPPKGNYAPHTIDGIVVHHTWRPTQAQYKKDATMRGIQNYHMDDNKWSDIGYHFIIGPEGTIYQGRPETVIGAHSTPNTGKVGICVVGDYDPGQDRFTDASQESLIQLMTWLTAEYGISTNEFYGHRDFAPKTCPGEDIYSKLGAMREEIIRRLKAAGL